MILGTPYNDKLNFNTARTTNTSVAQSALVVGAYEVPESCIPHGVGPLPSRSPCFTLSEELVRTLNVGRANLTEDLNPIPCTVEPSRMI